MREQEDGRWMTVWPTFWATFWENPISVGPSATVEVFFSLSKLGQSSDGSFQLARFFPFPRCLGRLSILDRACMLLHLLHLSLPHCPFRICQWPFPGSRWEGDAEGRSSSAAPNLPTLPASSRPQARPRFESSSHEHLPSFSSFGIF